MRNEDVADRLSADFGFNFHPLIFDITDHESIEHSVEKVGNVIGNEGLFCLVNNAGRAIGGPVMHIPLENFQRQFDVNFFDK